MLKALALSLVLVTTPPGYSDDWWDAPGYDEEWWDRTRPEEHPYNPGGEWRDLVPEPREREWFPPEGYDAQETDIA